MSDTNEPGFEELFTEAAEKKDDAMGLGAKPEPKPESPAVVPETPESAAAEPSAAEVPAATPDPWQAVPEDLRKQYQDVLKRRDDAVALSAKLEQKIRSEEGRYQAARRLLADRARAPAKPEPEPAPAALPAELAAIDSEYPEIGAAMKASHAATQAAIADLQSKIGVSTPLPENVQKLASDLQLADLYAKTEALSPGWQVTTKEPAFSPWLALQHANIIALTESNEPQDAAYVVSLYRQAHPAPADPQPATETKPDPKQERLARAVTTSSRQPTPLPVAADDFDSAFTHFASKKDREAASLRG